VAYALCAHQGNIITTEIFVDGISGVTLSMGVARGGVDVFLAVKYLP
jgi:hypothetical protein